MTSENQQLPALRTDPSELPALAAGLVHEVKNPLAAIHMHLQLLENYVGAVGDDGLREKMDSKVNLIKREIQSLNRTLHNFISFLRPQETQKEVRVQLDDLVREVIDLTEPQALREGIEITYQPGGPPELLNVDAIFIKQVVLNLILNSIQALQRSERDPEDRRIVVSTGERGSLTYFMVGDNGPGISQDVQERIFDPFFSTRKGEGSGLGLTLVKKMVTELGGHIEVHSTPGQGTSFAILLPQNVGIESSASDESDDTQSD